MLQNFWDRLLGRTIIYDENGCRFVLGQTRCWDNRNWATRSEVRAAFVDSIYHQQFQVYTLGVERSSFYWVHVWFSLSSSNISLGCHAFTGSAADAVRRWLA